MAEPAVVIDRVSKSYRLYHERQHSLKSTILTRRRSRFEEFWALRDVSFEVARGKTFGLIGENGSGKSTLLKCIAGILQPNEGSIVTNGRVAALLELGSGFHQELTGRENVYLNGSILGLSKREIDEKFEQIAEFAGVDQYIDQPVKNYSSGMYVRLGFAVAIHLDPDILLVDEVLAVGDASFQRKCMDKFRELKLAGKTVVLVSHSTGPMRTFCDEVARLEHGRLVAVGKPEQIIDDYVDEGQEDVQHLPGGAVRSGSGEARITDLALLDASGKRTTHVHTGEEVTIEVTFEARERIEKPVFGLSFESVDGIYVWEQHTRDGGLEIDAIEGTGRIRYTIPNLLLQPEEFYIHASILDYTTAHSYDVLRNSFRFRVGRGTPVQSNGIVSIPGSWERLADRASASPVP